MKSAWVDRAAKWLKMREGPSWPGGRVLIESPYAGNVVRNRRYARAAMRDSLYRGEFPFLSHLLYTQVLNDMDPDERALGIAAELNWGRLADATVIYVDLGISSGMQRGIHEANERGRPVAVRRLRGRWEGKGTI